MSSQYSGAQGPDQQPGTSQGADGPRTVLEWVEVGGDQLVSTVRRLVAEGNVRRVVLRTSSGRELLTFPVTAGAVVGGATVLAAPVLAAVGVVAAMVASVTVGIERDEPGPGDETSSSAGPGAGPAEEPRGRGAVPPGGEPGPSDAAGPSFPPSPASGGSEVL